MKRRIRSEIWGLIINVGALVGVLLASAAGASPRRLRPAADFLLLGAAAAIYVEVTFHLLRRRAIRQRGGEVPQGIHLRKPAWMRIADPAAMVAFGAAAGAVAAGAGFTDVGVGILLTVTALWAGIAVMPFGHQEGLTFQPEGLRVHIRGASFLVRWEAISQVDRGGSDDHRLIYVGIRDIRPVVRSVEPDTPRMRFRAQIAVADEEPAGKLTFVPWTAGLDSAVLARAINAGVERQVGRVN